MEIVEKSIILTFDELRILLYSQGERSCEGVYMPKKEYLPESIINSLDAMNKNGLLKNEGSHAQNEALPTILGDSDEVNSKDNEEKFFIREDLLDMLRIISNHTATEILELEEGRKLFCYYSENGVLTSEKCSNRRDSVRLTHYTAESFEKFKESIEEDDKWSLLL
ncbi:MAG: hypothetical protein IKE52_07440 [Mogibacterium sp.]|nr:hypothetical protein [Mogibacterium sp.]